MDPRSWCSDSLAWFSYRLGFEFLIPKSSERNLPASCLKQLVWSASQTFQIWTKFSILNNDDRYNNLHYLQCFVNFCQLEFRPLLSAFRLEIAIGFNFTWSIGGMRSSKNVLVRRSFLSCFAVFGIPQWSGNQFKDFAERIVIFLTLFSFSRRKTPLFTASIYGLDISS